MSAAGAPTAPMPAVVAVAYDRPAALARLLASLARARYPEGSEVPLVVSIDHGGDPAVGEAADAFPWPHGPKEVLRRPSRMGLRDHILACGDLTERFGAVILLEDDLLVSPHFHAYARDALAYYAGDPRIAGVSLYTHHRNVFVRRPFLPLPDGSDVFFLQLASSWGQAWSAAQWRRFRAWYGPGRAVEAADPLPAQVVAWPDSSWLKRFVKYMVEVGAYFVYPRVSLTTNFGDPGTHFLNQEAAYQVPLLVEERAFRFRPLEGAVAMYDAFFEPVPEAVGRLTGRFDGYTFEVDLYATKDVARVRADYLLTTRPCAAARFRFADRMRPPVLNAVHGIEGEGIAFCRREDVRGAPATARPTYAEFAAAYPGLLGLRYALRKLAQGLAGALGRGGGR